MANFDIYNSNIPAQDAQNFNTLFQQGMKIQQDIEQSVGKNRANNMLKKLFEQGATQEQMVMEYPNILVKAGLQTDAIKYMQANVKAKQDKIKEMTPTKIVYKDPNGKPMPGMQTGAGIFDAEGNKLPLGTEIYRSAADIENYLNKKLGGAKIDVQKQKDLIPGKVEEATRIAEVKLEFKKREEDYSKKIYDEKELDKIVRSKEYGNAKEGFDSITNALVMIEDDPMIYRNFIAKKLGRGQAAKFDVALKNAEDIVTRIRTGAALNKNEQKFYDDLFNPGWTSDPDTAVWKMIYLQRIFKEDLRRKLYPRSERINIQKLIPDSAPANLPGEESLLNGDKDTSNTNNADLSPGAQAVFNILSVEK